MLQCLTFAKQPMEWQSSIFDQDGGCQSFQSPKLFLKALQNLHQKTSKFSGSLFAQHRMLTKGRWKAEEKMLYFQFVKANYWVFEGRGQKVVDFNRYLKMSEFVKTKNYFDCRRFHNRMCRKFRDAEQIIVFFTRYFSCHKKGRGKLSQFRGLHVELDSEEKLLNSFHSIKIEDCITISKINSEPNIL